MFQDLICAGHKFLCTRAIFVCDWCAMDMRLLNTCTLKFYSQGNHQVLESKVWLTNYYEQNF